MVGDTAYGDRVSTYIMYYASDVRKDLSEILFADGYAGAFDVEDDVDVEFCVGVSHSVLLFVFVLCAGDFYCLIGTHISCLVGHLHLFKSRD